MAAFSCSRQIEPEIAPAETQEGTTAQAKTYTLTVVAGKGGPETKALDLDDGTHTLTATWKEGEKVTVYNVTQEADLGGCLEAQGNGPSTTLKGTLEGTIEDGDKLLLKFCSPDYSEQQGTLEYIAANCDYATAEVEVSLQDGGDDITVSDATFESRQAIVKFSLKWNSTGELISTGVNSLAIHTGETEITVTPDPAASILFVALPALDKADIDMTATYGVAQYVYKKNGVTFTQGKYYEIGVQMSLVIPIPDERTLRAFLTSEQDFHNGATGQVTKNITLHNADPYYDDTSDIKAFRTKTIDLNGKTLSGKNISRLFSVTENAKLTITGGGRIKDGKADNGGAIYNNGTLIIEDVTISGNTASADGGAIYNDGGSITVNGGSISNNTAANDGGGIHMQGGTLTMTGGTIKGNVATNAARGGGISVNGTLNMSGNPKVYDNTSDGNSSNVFLNTGNVIHVNGAFTEGANIGVTLNGGEGKVTSGYSTHNGSADPSASFFSDNASRLLLTSGEVELACWYKKTNETTYASLKALLQKTGYDAQLQNYYGLLGFVFSDTDKPTKAISYTYRSSDPDGKSVELSAVIYVPLERTNPLAGICLANHGTIASNDQCPSVSMSKGTAQFEGGFAWKNYVVVMPDYYGFGASSGRPQGYLDAENTARNSIDAYLAACKMLEDKATEWGITFQETPKLYSFGYSQGGFNSMANLKYVTMHPELDLHFDKVICGGSPFDVEGTWNEYVEGNFHNSLAFVPMTVVSINETHNLGLSYGDVFRGTLSSHVQDWILDKTLTTTQINTKITDAYGSDATMSSIMTEQFMSEDSDAFDAILGVCRRYTLASDDSATDWTPDENTKIVLYHSTNDDTVPASNLTTMTTMLDRVGHPGDNIRTITGRDGDHINAVPQFILQITFYQNEW